MGSLWGAAGVGGLPVRPAAGFVQGSVIRHRPEELVGQELRAVGVLQREGWDNGR